MSLPATHQALVVVEKGKVAVQDKALPNLNTEEILVRVKAVALNPTDWKHIDHLLKPGQSIGCDFAGEVAALGEAAKAKNSWNVGDRVAGFVRGGFVESDNGAFQEYLAVLPELVWRIPEDLSDEEAAPMGGIALSTAAQGIIQKLGAPYEPLSKPEPLLVWAGSTGVGMYAIKLASVLGYKVVTTASPRNFELVKSLGASAVFSYSDPETPSKIKEWAAQEGLGPIKLAFDPISEHGSTATVVKALPEGGKVITLLPQGPIDSPVEVINILIYSVLKPKNVEDHKFIIEWYKKLPSLIKNGSLGQGRVPLKIWDGLEALPEAIDYVRQGKISGEKGVVKIASQGSNSAKL